MFKKSAKEIGRRPNNSQKSEKVISYYSASRKQLDTFERNRGRVESKRIKPKVKIAKSKITRLIAIILVLFICVYSSLLGSDPVIKIDGVQYRSLKSYQLLAQQVLASDARNKLKFLLQSQNDSSKLREQIPEAAYIKVGSSLLGHSPVITIATEKAFIIFQQKGAPDFIISQSGKALLAVSDALKVYGTLPRLINNSGLNNRAGEQVLSPDEANDLLQLIAQYRSDNSFPTFSLTSNPYEINVTEAGKPYYVKLSLDTSILTQYGSLRATELKLKQLGQSPSQYIDVRLSDKVYYL
ncbi:MAG: hypothetical protein WCP46_06820 [Alphaproteobacteria bacterium]